VPTATPILLYRSSEGGQCADWLLMRQVPGKDILRHLADGDLSVREEHDTARNIGRLMRLLGSQRRHNRDSKLSNLIRLPDGQIGVIDTVGVRGRPGETIRMLRDMLNEAIGTSHVPRRALMMRCLRASMHDPARAWRELGQRAAEPRERTPRTDPLREPTPVSDRLLGSYVSAIIWWLTVSTT